MKAIGSQTCAADCVAKKNFYGGHKKIGEENLPEYFWPADSCCCPFVCLGIKVLDIALLNTILQLGWEYKFFMLKVEEKFSFDKSFFDPSQISHNIQ